MKKFLLLLIVPFLSFSQQLITENMIFDGQEREYILYIPSSYDATSEFPLLFSFHGLPERQIKRLDTSGSYCINTDNCCEQASEFNEFCYRFHCSLTVQKIMEKLGTDKSYRMCFQSRFGMDKWIQPDILTVLQDSANNGVKNIAVSCPSFVADCLETLEEIAIRDKDAFIAMGGEKLDLIPSLNDAHDWVIGFSDYLYRNS